MKLPDLKSVSRLAAQIRPMLQAGDCVTLTGDVGSGKTSFARALLGQIDPMLNNVPSPTFSLLQTYETNLGPVWHYDLYRLNSPAELLELAWDDLPTVISIIEWPSNADGMLPKDRLNLTFVMNEKSERFVILSPFGTWQSRIKKYDAFT